MTDCSLLTYIELYCVTRSLYKGVTAVKDVSRATQHSSLC